MLHDASAALDVPAPPAAARAACAIIAALLELVFDALPKRAGQI